jgi:NTP pyrophosphatase (non-canonical NTP hydrolase)
MKTGPLRVVEIVALVCRNEIDLRAAAGQPAHRVRVDDEATLDIGPLSLCSRDPTCGKGRPEDEMPDDDVTTLADLKAAVARFSDERDWAQFHGAKDLAIGIATEAAELLEGFRFQPESAVDGRMADAAVRGRVENEMADVLFFVLRLAQRYGIDVSRAFARKLAVNETRYPVAKARGSNRKYTEP